MINVIYIIFGCFFGGCGIYLYLRPKLKKIIAINIQRQQDNCLIDKQNKELQILNGELLEENDSLSQSIIQATEKRNSLNDSIKMATEQFKSLSASLEESANSIYEQSKQIAEEKMKTAQLLLQKEYDEYKRQLELDYELKQNESKEKALILQQNIEKTEAKLEELTLEVQNAIEAARRQEELENNLDFYRIVLSPEDENEIKAFLSIEHLISNKRAIRMFLWTNYYSKRANELATRILGAADICGIYKITNVKTQQIYIGQSVDCKDRIKQHLKHALGIDSPNNKLYTNMQKYGIENFTFELMEKCSKEKLDERERYWISFYQSNIMGLNSTKGNN